MIAKDEGGHSYLPYSHATIGSFQVIAGAIDIEPYFTGLHAVDYEETVTLYQKLLRVCAEYLAALQKK
jgi:hypothetical protein